MKPLFLDMKTHGKNKMDFLFSIIKFVLMDRTPFELLLKSVHLKKHIAFGTQQENLKAFLVRM